MPAARVKEYLDSHGVKFESIFHTPTYTSQETAQETHIRGKELVKTVVVEADDKYMLVAAPASRLVDVQKIKQLTGNSDAHLADESTFGKLFPGCELGAMPPLGHLFHIDMLADESIQEDQEVAFNAGTHTEIVKMSFLDFQRLEHPQFADLTVHMDPGM